MVETINFHGNNDLRFRYKGDITKIRLWSGKTVAYESPPIDAYRPSGQPIGMYLEWNGPEASVEIADSCSISSFWRGFF